MKKFRVYARHKNGYNAPYMVIQASDERSAIAIGKTQTRLSDFEQWDIKCSPIKNNK